MFYSIVGAAFLIVALIVIVYTICNSLIKEFIRMNNDKEEE